MSKSKRLQSAARNFFYSTLGVVAFLLMLSAGYQTAHAQPSGAVQSIYPTTRDTGALITMTAHAAGTYYSAVQSGYNVSTATCVLTQTAHTSSPSTTMTIQNYDAASASYYDVLVSAAITNDATTNPIVVGRGQAVTSNVSTSFPIAARWRIKVVQGGTGTLTGTVGCSLQ